MGAGKSKCFSSKHNTSKKYISKLLKLGLRPEEADHMFNLLKEQRCVKMSSVRSAWQEFVTSFVMDLYEHYLLSHSDKKLEADSVDIVTYSSFLINFVKGTIEDRLNMYLFFLNIDDDKVDSKNIVKYLTELMKSVLLLMRMKNVPQYDEWTENGSHFSDECVENWALATLRNVCDSDNMEVLNLEKMSSWMTLNTDITWFQCYLFYSLYELERLETHRNGEHGGVHCPLPYLVIDGSRDDWKAVLNIPSVLFINSHLPTENRYQWRLAYSVDIHGEGFTTFRSLICNRGPTVLVIKDKDNHVFGGYASTSWHVGPQFFGDQRCFLFSLLPEMKMYPTLPHNDHFLYLNVNQKALPNGLGMGGQLGYWGLWIDASFEFGNCSPSCSTYAGYKMLSGSPTFNISGLEVWCAEGNMNDDDGSTCNSINDFLKKDDQPTSILHKDPGARALMDMLGKSGSGRDYLANPHH